MMMRCCISIANRMKHTIKIVLVITVLAAVSNSRGYAGEFESANQLYQSGEYIEAQNVYESLLEREPFYELYYNLANAYFKNEKLGRAILNYERALALAPRDRDVIANLAYANQLIEFDVEDRRSWHVRTLGVVLNRVQFEECLLATLLIYLAFVSQLGVALLYRAQKLLGRASIFLLSLVVLSSLLTFLKFTNMGAGTQAIVTDATAEVRYGPSRSDRLAFRLVEGIKVAVKDNKEGWIRVELPDNRSGWTPQSSITNI
jgi:hypothetical protein